MLLWSKEHHALTLPLRRRDTGGIGDLDAWHINASGKSRSWLRGHLLAHNQTPSM
jgi:hypothetical protein